MKNWIEDEGSPSPLGATWIPEEQAYNFAIYSKHAEKVELLFFDQKVLDEPALSIELIPAINKSGRIWHYRIPLSKLNGSRFYAYRMDGPGTVSPLVQHAFDPDKILLDPYASVTHIPDRFCRESCSNPGSNVGKSPLGYLWQHDDRFDWEDDRSIRHTNDLVVYEMHVRGFTANPNSNVKSHHRGSFKGMIDRIDHLKELGVTAVQLMPIQQNDPSTGNYWGYMPINFFSPKESFASKPLEQLNEFRELVKQLHRAGIEVILDVVYSHTAEGDSTGPTYSLRGIDNTTYYEETSNPYGPLKNKSTLGNTLHLRNRQVRRLLLDSLRFWVQVCHVDGFRFDIASMVARGLNERIERWSQQPLLGVIRDDPVLANVRMIADPIDQPGPLSLGAGFPGLRWYQWNTRFRDDVRKYVKGDPGKVGSMMYRVYGSDDLFPDDRFNAFHPYQSVNYVTCHDGFTLYDLVSYNEKHNEANGHHNQDGHNKNDSWNCGLEGDEHLTDIVQKLRSKQARNFFCLLMLSNGTPLIRSGDEFLDTQFGNNNPYNQDNETSWVDWRRKEENEDLLRFVRMLIQLRKEHPSICRSRFWKKEVKWHGTGAKTDLSNESRSFAFYLNGKSQMDNDFYVMSNAYHEPLTFQIQTGKSNEWFRVIDTALPIAQSICEPGTEVKLKSMKYQVESRSTVVLIRK